MPSVDKFKKSINNLENDDVKNRILNGYDDVSDRSGKDVKRKFFSNAINVMNETLPKDEIIRIMDDNACCRSGMRAKNSKNFSNMHKHSNIDERLEILRQDSLLYMGEANRDGNYIIVKGVNYRVNGQYRCACSAISGVKNEIKIPNEYCLCCAGHFRYHYEIMLGIKLETEEVISSSLNKNEPCVFRYKIEGAQR